MLTARFFTAMPGANLFAGRFLTLHSSPITHHSALPAFVWPQPLAPMHNLGVSALFATLPLAVVLIFMGGLRKSGALSAGLGLATAFVLAVFVWGMPFPLAVASGLFGFAYAVWPILWIVFAALWLYNLSVDIGNFDLLRRWMRDHASGDPCIQAILVAFCFGALLEGTSGFGSPVAVAGFLLLGLGFTARRAVTLALIANTTPVAFGALGIPIVALANVTGLNLLKLSAMVGRQLPFLSLILPAYLVLVVAGVRGLKRAWPAALVGGGCFALAQFVCSNFWGPYAADIVAAMVSTAGVIGLLRVWQPAPSLAPGDATPGHVPVSPEDALSGRQALAAWAPWALLAGVMVAWSYLKLFPVGQKLLPVPHLHNEVFITLYKKGYAAIFNFQPLAAGTAGMVAILLTALFLRTPPRTVLKSGVKTLRQLRMPGLTVGLIVALAYLYNYSGMAYTLGAFLAGMGKLFPLVSGFLGWIACFLSGSDTASNLLFGNLQVAAAHQIGVSPILLAATNSSGAVTGKMISPQNIAVGVTTVGLVGHEGDVVRSTLGHSLLLALLLSLIVLAQAYWLTWMIP
ncbi:MAG TPA: L-lactate permease [Terriglobia bacterium]|nr:L-lactate permease [Terriglobia bacterium]